MRKFIWGAALTVGLVGASATANAQFQIYMSDNHGNVLIVGDGSAGDTDAASGAISIDPALLTATFSELDSRSVVAAANNIGSSDDYRFLELTDHIYNQTATGPATSDVYIATSAVGFGVPYTSTRQLDASAAGVFTGSTALTANYDFWAGPNNTLDEQGVEVPGDFYKSAKSGPNFYGGDYGPAFMPGPNYYSMFIQSNYTLVQASNIQSTSIITATGVVPEPASLAALAVGAVSLLRRRKKS